PPRSQAAHQRRGVPTATRRHQPIERAREGTQGRHSHPARPAFHPDDRLFGSATPEPDPDRRTASCPPRRGWPRRARERVENRVLTANRTSLGDTSRLSTPAIMDSRYGPSRDGRKVLKSAILSGRAPGRVARCSVFIRFVVGSDGEHHRELTGIVTEARFLREEG